MVGLVGFEPTTSASRTQRSTKLSHSPCPTINILMTPALWQVSGCSYLGGAFNFEAVSIGVN